MNLVGILFYVFIVSFDDEMLEMVFMSVFYAWRAVYYELELPFIFGLILRENGICHVLEPTDWKSGWE